MPGGDSQGRRPRISAREAVAETRKQGLVLWDVSAHGCRGHGSIGNDKRRHQGAPGDRLCGQQAQKQAGGPERAVLQQEGHRSGHRLQAAADRGGRPRQEPQGLGHQRVLRAQRPLRGDRDAAEQARRRGVPLAPRCAQHRTNSGPGRRIAAEGPIAQQPIACAQPRCRSPTILPLPEGRGGAMGRPSPRPCEGEEGRPRPLPRSLGRGAWARTAAKDITRRGIGTG
mmetsp:Transcript_29757/g.70957  ORF Transcript_29757/g.70957 Transcript_29757/m.70957 type:complete len:227 (-) Transcript_29757:131-811(-)